MQEFQDVTEEFAATVAPAGSVTVIWAPAVFVEGEDSLALGRVWENPEDDAAFESL